MLLSCRNSGHIYLEPIIPMKIGLNKTKMLHINTTIRINRPTLIQNQFQRIGLNLFTNPSNENSCQVNRLLFQVVFFLPMPSLKQDKGIVQPKMKIQSLSSHPHANGEPGEALESTKHCRSLTGRRRCCDIPHN